MITEISYTDWLAKARELFGLNPALWRFVCPVCGHVASVQQYRDAGATDADAGIVCIGRFLLERQDAFGGKRRARKRKGAGNPPIKSPCNYAGYGLFRLNPVRVKQDSDVVEVFAFDGWPSPEVKEALS